MTAAQKWYPRHFIVRLVVVGLVFLGVLVVLGITYASSTRRAFNAALQTMALQVRAIEGLQAISHMPEPVVGSATAVVAGAPRRPEPLSAHMTKVLENMEAAKKRPIDFLELEGSDDPPRPNPWGGRAPSDVTPVARPCPEGCDDFGLYCDTERGLCECPFGRNGRSCEKLSLPTCQLTALPTDHDAAARAVEANPAAYVPHCGDVSLPRACDCLARCSSLGFVHMHADYLGTYERVPCWARPTGVPDSGDAPTPMERGVSWFASLRAHESLDRHVTLGDSDGVGGGPSRRATLVTPMWTYGLPEGTWLLPLASCTRSCSYRGRCVVLPPPLEVGAASPVATATESAGSQRWPATMKSDPEGGTCICYLGSRGTACENDDPKVCFNACSGHGRCVQGACKCRSGWWGIDCSRPATPPARPAVSPPPASPSSPPLLIYIYEMPFAAGAVYESDVEAGFTGHDATYVAYSIFLSRLLADNRVRTLDPEAATAFYVPTWTYARAGNVGNPGAGLRIARLTVEQGWPYWARHGGRDHIFFSGPNDQGSCWGADAVRPAMRLVHYGRRDVFPSVTSGWLAPCAASERDVVAAPHKDKATEVARATYGGPAAPRPYLLYFAGSVRPEEPEYSQGVRQAATTLLAGAPGVVIRTERITSSAYSADLRSSRFCLVASGFGFGARLTEAMIHGCVPVRVEDNLALPYEDILPYDSFSLAVRLRDLGGLPDLLAAVRPEQLAALQRGVKRYHGAFLWQSGNSSGPGMVAGTGGWAYELTLQALAARLRARAALASLGDKK